MTEVPAELQIEIDKLERKHAENPDGRFFVPLANAYRRSGNGAAAERLLRAGVERHPGYLSARIVLGRCLADRGAITEAEDEFRYVVSEDPHNVVALRTLAELARQEGHIDDALGWYHELLAVDPQNEEARRALDELQATSDAPEPDGAAATEPLETRLYADDDQMAPMTEERLVAETEAGEDTEPEVPLEVVTETIADLYARQGLHDRAAAVYRELIRRRGADPDLERRLQAVEAAAADDGVLALEDEEALLTPALDSEIDTFADSFMDGFPGAQLEDPPPASHDSRGEQGEEFREESPEEPAVSIVGFLSRLATWTPGGAAATPEASPPEESGPGTPPADDEPFPWELPVEDAPAVSMDGGAAAPVLDSAGGSEPLQEENDDDYESFQDWLRSLKQ